MPRLLPLVPVVPPVLQRVAFLAFWTLSAPVQTPEPVSGLEDIGADLVLLRNYPYRVPSSGCVTPNPARQIVLLAGEKTKPHTPVPRVWT